MCVKKRVFSARFFIFGSLGALALTACSVSGNGTNSGKSPLVTDVQVTKISSAMPSAQAGKSATDSVNVILTLDKSQILGGREFLYNLDLQHSSLFDQGMNLSQQSLVVTTVPVTFRIAGNQLELITNNQLQSASDENHPEQLIGTYQILAQTDTQLTVSGMDSSAYLASQLGPVDPTSKVVSYQSHWIRSFEFDPHGTYLLQESSVLMSDGKTTGEFMESIFPRENIAAGPNFQKIQMDPSNPAGGNDGVVARYRLLPTDPVFEGQNKVSFANHFDLSPRADGTPATIDWYVTDNAPDSVLPYLKEAVEGWNRYFIQMKDIERPVMNFMGKLPADKHLGDPRFNVINWDGIQIAGAAYESQASDPETGRQSHSLIYMPAAWLAIGATYWQGGVSSENIHDGDSNAPTKPTTALGKRMGCYRDLSEGMMLMASGRFVDTEVKNFAIQLLKQTLFHEVGHSLGLAHNFEGSLAFDRSNPKSIFSYSIMDYNDYELERQAFDSLDATMGPLLEYDRQVISALYNKAQSVADSDPVLLACNDAESDTQVGGVNPLCIRYDAEKDPTLSVNTAFNRIEQDSLPGDVTLSQALSRVPGLILTQDKLNAIASKEDLENLAESFASTLKGTLAFYLTSSVTSVNKAVRTNIRSLYEFDLDLPAPYDASAMRERVLAGVQKTLALNDLPEGTKTALTNAQVAGLQLLGSAPFVKTLPGFTDELGSLNKAITTLLSGYLTSPSLGLPAVRAKVLGNLAYPVKVDFFLGPEGGNTKDYELAVVNILSSALANKALSDGERLAAATSLATFKGRLTGDNAIATLKPALLQERALAATNEQRTLIEAIVAALQLNGAAPAVHTLAAK